VENGTFTLLTAGQFAPEREGIGQMHCWLAKCADLYQNRRNVAPVGLLYPDEGLWQSWHQVAPRYFGIGQALLAAGVPWRVVTAEDDWSGLDVLYCLDRAPVREPIPSGLRIVSVSDLAGWEPPPPSFLARHKIARSAASWVAGRLFQTYFRSRLARRLVDGLGLVHFFWQTPLFRLPPAPTRQALVAELGKRPHPRVTAEAPVLVELWRQGDKLQLHLVNYASEPQPVKVDLGQSISGRAVSPDNPTVEFTHRTLDVLLDVYTVIDYSAESHTTVV
jgi:hypothetical protein